MKIGNDGLRIIKHFEGCKLKAYRCPAGIMTIGYGSTGPHVKEGMVITEQEAERLLLDDIERFERGVEKLTKNIPQCQFDALASFAFNLGLGNLEKSTLLRKLKAGDIGGAADEFLKWNKAGGKVLAGLIKRRAAERDLFLGSSIESHLS